MVVADHTRVIGIIVIQYFKMDYSALFPQVLYSSI